MDLRVSEDPAADVAAMMLEAAAAGGHVVLTGGSTPGKAYAIAAADAGTDWSAATLWFGDERCVPSDHPLSNHRLADDTLISRLPEARRPRVHRIEGELGPERGAGAYEAVVREHMGAEPRWDLLLLGLGPDAHVASLYAGHPQLEVADRLAVGVEIAGWEPQVPRVSLTMPALNAARRVVFLVTGASKAVALGRAFGDPPDHAAPGSRVRPRDGELVVVCDAEAAEGLQR